jgi:hypothetical protein
VLTVKGEHVSMVVGGESCGGGGGGGGEGEPVSVLHMGDDFEVIVSDGSWMWYS